MVLPIWIQELFDWLGTKPDPKPKPEPPRKPKLTKAVKEQDTVAYKIEWRGPDRWGDVRDNSMRIEALYKNGELESVDIWKKSGWSSSNMISIPAGHWELFKQLIRFSVPNINQERERKTDGSPETDD